MNIYTALRVVRHDIGILVSFTVARVPSWSWWGQAKQGGPLPTGL